MRNVVISIIIAVCTIVLLSGVRAARSQGEGFISQRTQDSAGQQDTLPPGSERQGGQILHIVAQKENLHLLASYYYGDPRQWKRIYRDNRNVIRNPRILTAGQTLRITVEENWKPKFSYQEWFRLATRNGEWAPGRWKRASRVPARQQPPVAAETAPSRTQEAVTPPAAHQEEPSKTPEEVPVEEASAVEEGSQDTDTSTDEETTVVEDSPEEEPSDDEQAPAF